MRNENDFAQGSVWRCSHSSPIIFQILAHMRFQLDSSRTFIEDPPSPTLIKICLLTPTALKMTSLPDSLRETPNSFGPIIGYYLLGRWLLRSWKQKRPKYQLSPSHLSIRYFHNPSATKLNNLEIFARMFILVRISTKVQKPLI